MTASKIEWTNRSDWNPVRGCTRVSEGCRNCYAEVMAARFSDPGQWGHGFASIVDTPQGRDHRWSGKVELVEDRLTLPLRWANGQPGNNRCFVTSTSDPFHESLPDEAIDRLFAVMALRPDWIFQVLTKRSARMRTYLSRHRWHLWAAIGRAIDPKRWHNLPPIMGGDCTPMPNVWLGVSVEDQASADQRIPDLLATPAAVRFISAEPLLGPVDLTEIDGGAEGYFNALRGLRWGAAEETSDDCPELDWVIVGGESGPGARDNDFLTNARSLMHHCHHIGVPFFGKQGFRKADLPLDLQIREFPA